MARQHFGTDGARGIVGDTLTAELVERIGKAAVYWADGGDVLVARDTRGSGPVLEQALAAGIVSAGGEAVLAGILPTPAVALFTRRLGAVISASHNPPQYNGVKLFGAGGKKLSDADEEQVESFLDEPAVGGGGVRHDDGLAARYVEHVVERFGSDLGGLHIAVDCANGALFALAPEVFRALGARVTPIGVERSGAYAASSRAAPHAEKKPSAWPLPLGNVVFSSVGTLRVLGSFPQACGPALSPTSPQGSTCGAGGPGQFSLALYVPR